MSLLRTRRWLGFTAVVIGAILAFGLLSAWQWSRAEDKRDERVSLESSLSDVATDLTAVTADPLAGGEWRPILTSGTYLDEFTVLVRKRPLNGTNGLWVLTPFEADDGTIAWVNRGWIKAAQSATTSPIVPGAPAGPVTVEGLAREMDIAMPSDNDGLPSGQVAAVAAATLPDVGATSEFYVQVQSSTPEDGDLVPLPLPEIDDARNISYAIQWLLFAVVAVGGWFFFLRREARDDDRGTHNVPSSTG